VGAWPATATLNGTVNSGDLYVVGFNGV